MLNITIFKIEITSAVQNGLDDQVLEIYISLFF
jgi:hypothetical protein